MMSFHLRNKILIKTKDTQIIEMVGTETPIIIRMEIMRIMKNRNTKKRQSGAGKRIPSTKKEPPLIIMDLIFSEKSLKLIEILSQKRSEED